MNHLIDDVGIGKKLKEVIKNEKNEYIKTKEEVKNLLEENNIDYEYSDGEFIIRRSHGDTSIINNISRQHLRICLVNNPDEVVIIIGT